MFTQKSLNKWLTALKNGEVVAAPAEGVYGYCADPFNKKALQKLIDIKKRDPQKGLICLISDHLQLSQICAPLTQKEKELTEKYWSRAHKNPTTLLLPVHPQMPDLLTGGRTTLAVRLPQIDYVQQYLQAWGQPLVSSSLNVAGAQPAITHQEIPAHIPALVLETPLSGKTSCIINTQGQKMR